MNCSRNATRKHSASPHAIYYLPGCITRAIHPKLHTKPCYYIYKWGSVWYTSLLPSEQNSTSTGFVVIVPSPSFWNSGSVSLLHMVKLKTPSLTVTKSPLQVNGSNRQLRTRTQALVHYSQWQWWTYGLTPFELLMQSHCWACAGTIALKSPINWFMTPPRLFTLICMHMCVHNGIVSSI